MTSPLGKSFTIGLKSDTQPTGYPKNWTEISNAYRKSRNYICEFCGVNCSDKPEHRKSTDTHHKNGVKEDCCYENLECLCKYHHAELHPHYKRVIKKDLEILEELWNEQGIPPYKPGVKSRPINKK